MKPFLTSWSVALFLLLALCAPAALAKETLNGAALGSEFAALEIRWGQPGDVKEKGEAQTIHTWKREKYTVSVLVEDGQIVALRAQMNGLSSVNQKTAPQTGRGVKLGGPGRSVIKTYGPASESSASESGDILTLQYDLDILLVIQIYAGNDSVYSIQLVPEGTSLDDLETMFES